jgi:hypothetical protein
MTKQQMVERLRGFWGWEVKALGYPQLILVNEIEPEALQLYV